MKTAARCSVLAVLAALPMLALAQTSSSSSAQPAMPKFAPAPPPPGMNDPGVDAAHAPAQSSTSARIQDTPPEMERSTPAEMEPSHMPGKKIPLPQLPGQSSPATTDDTPDVQISQQGDNAIQTYSSNGRVYMVVVTPKVGPQQVYNVDQNGQMRDQNGLPPVHPVQYKILGWGDHKPASASSSGDGG